MKTLGYIVLALAIMVLSAPQTSGQVLKNVRKTEKKVTEGLGKLGKLINKEDEKKVEGEEVKQEGKEEVAKEEAVPEDNKPMLVWSKYDFVPGDKIIFEDNLLYEENGEFPSRWDLVQGNTENANFEGENIIMFRDGAPTIIPYLKNSNIDYLPEVFTVEFDIYINENSFTVYFYDRKNQRAPSGSTYLNIWPNRMDMSPASSDLPDKATIKKKWAHIALAYTNGKMKAYIDETRLINIPRLAFDPTGISLQAYNASSENPFFMKNIRIAEGGVKYYDRFLQDGKIVSNGIRFDTGKASLKPESMGVLNEIFMMLNDHPEISVSIEGHTDSDGDPDLNQKLSEDRSVTVMQQLISMGISQERLSYQGFGEGNPIGPNDTPEGKAANRRVEFVKTN